MNKPRATEHRAPAEAFVRKEEKSPHQRSEKDRQNKTSEKTSPPVTKKEKGPHRPRVNRRGRCQK